MSEMCCDLCLQMSPGKNKQRLCSQEKAEREGILGPTLDPASQVCLTVGYIRSFCMKPQIYW